MKRKLMIIVAVSLFLAIILWLTGLSEFFYQFNVDIIEKLFLMISSNK